MSQLQLVVFLSLAVAGLFLLAAATWMLRRRAGKGRRSDAAEPSTIDMANIPLPADEADVVAVRLMPLKLTVGTADVTLDYRLQVINTGTGHLLGLRLALDLHSAGPGDDPRRALLGPDLGRAVRATIHQIDPRQYEEVSGRTALSLAEARSIASDDARQILPLVRLRIVGAGTPVRRFAFAVGKPSGGQEGLLLPIALDDGPKIHSPLAARQID